MRLGLLIPTRGAVMQSARRPPVEDCWTMAREADIAIAVEPEAGLLGRLAPGGAERLRALAPLSREARAAAHAAGIVVLDAPVLAAGRLELGAYLREQAISRTVHRYGNVMEETSA